MVDETAMIRTQRGMHNKSDMAAVYGTPCVQDISLFQCHIQNGSGNHKPSYPVDNRSAFP
jgi:hypothetical protein